MKSANLVKLLAVLHIVAMLNVMFIDAGFGGPALILTGNHGMLGPANLLAAGLVIKLLKEFGKHGGHGGLGGLGGFHKGHHHHHGGHHHGGHHDHHGGHHGGGFQSGFSGGDDVGHGYYGGHEQDNFGGGGGFGGGGAEGFIGHDYQMHEKRRGGNKKRNGFKPSSQTIIL